MNAKLVGPLLGAEQYHRLFESIRFYERQGFKYINAPWCVSEEAMMITRPEWAKSSICVLIAGGQPMCPVASAEQSFLQLQMDAIGRGEPMAGKFVAMTPCFRNEPVLDELHHAYFLKVELIELGPNVNRDNMLQMIDAAQVWIGAHVPNIAVPNKEHDPIAITEGMDIETFTGIELGSYGVREHPSIGRWVFGTGLAEPRMTWAIDHFEPPVHG